MKQCDLTKGLVVFLTIMITLFCGVMPSSGAQDSVVFECDCCDGQEFEGCYAFWHDGMMITPATDPLPVPVPIASVGVLYLDEMGSNSIGILTGHEIVNLGGISFPATLSGTYTVDLDCTGTAWICATPSNPNLAPIKSTISFVITSGGKEIQMVTTQMTSCDNNNNNNNNNVVVALPLNIVGTAKKQICDD